MPDQTHKLDLESYFTAEPPYGLSRLLRDCIDTGEGTPGQILHALLRAARLHLGMDIGFISQFADGWRTFRYVDAGAGYNLLKVGNSDPLEESYCQRVIDGRLPQLIPDAQEDAAARLLPATLEFGIGAHLSVPVKLADGSLFGTFCCFSFRADHSLNERDVSLLRAFADVAGNLLGKDIEREKALDVARRRLETVMEGDGFSMVWQPITDTEEQRIVGVESLARFSTQPQRPPDAWFNEAAAVGMADRLEYRAIEKALAVLEYVPPDVYVACNVSAQAFLGGRIPELLANGHAQRIVVEITEHDVVNDYEALERTLRPLRARGVRLAVDDAGAGYASLRHILRLRPDIIKLDVSLTRDIHADAARRALVSALVRFAHGTGSELVAEGVETAVELDVLRALGVGKVQGYFLHRPLPLPELTMLLRRQVWPDAGT